MNRIKELRIQRNLTQEDIAKYIGVSSMSISRWEKGESQIKPDKAQALADYFNVSVGNLLGYTNDDQLIEELQEQLGDFTIDEVLEGISPERELLQKMENERLAQRKNGGISFPKQKYKRSLTDEEVKSLPREKQQEYINYSLKKIRREIQKLNDSMGALKLAHKYTDFDLNLQTNELTSDLIKMLADIEQMKTNANSRSTQENNDL